MPPRTNCTNHPLVSAGNNTGTDIFDIACAYVGGEFTSTTVLMETNPFIPAFPFLTNPVENFCFGPSGVPPPPPPSPPPPPPTSGGSRGRAGAERASLAAVVAAWGAACVAGRCA